MAQVFPRDDLLDGHLGTLPDGVEQSQGLGIGRLVGIAHDGLDIVEVDLGQAKHVSVDAAVVRLGEAIDLLRADDILLDVGPLRARALRLAVDIRVGGIGTELGIDLAIGGHAVVTANLVVNLLAQCGIVVVGELVEQVVGAVGGPAPCVLVSHHCRPGQEAGHALCCTADTRAGDELQLEEALLVVVDCRGSEEVGVVVEQLCTTLVDDLLGCLLGQVEVVGIVLAAVHVGLSLDVAAVVLSVGGQSGHGEVDAREHAEG